MKRIVVALFVLSAACSTMAAGLKPFQDKDTELWGLKNAKGKVVVKPQFQSVLGSGQNETLIPVFKNNQVYRLDANGKMKFESVFYDNGPDYYEEGLARFLENGKVGFHDPKGNVVVKPAYDFARYFQGGHAVVCQGCWAAYATNPKFKAMSSGGRPASMSEEYMDVKGGKWGAINAKGEVVVPITHDSIEEVEAKLPAKK